MVIVYFLVEITTYSKLEKLQDSIQYDLAFIYVCRLTLIFICTGIGKSLEGNKSVQSD